MLLCIFFSVDRVSYSTIVIYY